MPGTVFALKDKDGKPRKRADGSTVYRARWTNPYDKSAQPVYMRHRDKTVAKDWLSRMDAEARDQHLNPAPAAPAKEQTMTFAQMVAEWRETRLSGLAPRTQTRYDQILRLYLLPEWGSKTLADITRKDAKLLFARLRKTLSAGTLRKVQVVASSVFSEAIDNDIMTRNPCARHKLPAVQQTEMLTLTAAEVDALADAIDPRYRTLVYVAAYCGPRAGELWALRRQDVDLEGRQLHIRRALKRSYGQGNPTDADLFGTPKSGKARVVRLPRSLADMLAEHLKTVGRSPGALIFTAPSGGVMRHELFTRRFYKPALKAAVGNASIADAKLGLRFHDLRHTAGALAISNGASPQQVTDRLGHADPRTTARYSHLFEGHDTDLLDNLDTTLSKQPRRLRAVS